MSGPVRKTSGFRTVQTFKICQTSRPDLMFVRALFSWDIIFLSFNLVLLQKYFGPIVHSVSTWERSRVTENCGKFPRKWSLQKKIKNLFCYDIPAVGTSFLIWNEAHINRRHTYILTSAKASKIIRLGKWLFPINDWCFIYGCSMEKFELIQ